MSILTELRLAVAVPVAAITFVLSGCSDQLYNPGPARASESASRAHNATLGDATASARWSAITRDFVASKPADTKPNAVAALRAFAYLSLAQYRAVVAAEDVPGVPPHASPQGAVAAASSAVLSALFPADAGVFAS